MLQGKNKQSYLSYSKVFYLLDNLLNVALQTIHFSGVSS